MAADSLRIGDSVCLFSEESYCQGYVFGTQSSSIHSELAVKGRQKRERPNVPDNQVISFRVCVANRYKLNKKYRKLQAKAEASPEDLTIKTQASSALIGAEAENEDNVSEQQRQQGKKVLYGQIVQLQHMFTDKYIHVSTTQTSHTETSNMQVYVADYNAKQCQFRIMPRYKVKAEGDMVQVDDQIVLESVKSPGQFLHVSKAAFNAESVYKGEHELNLSVRQCGFTIVRQYKPEKDHVNYIKAGNPLRLFHKEIEGFFVAEGRFGEVLQDPHLRLRPVDQNKPKSLFPSTSAITYWQIEMDEGAINGNVVKWGQQCRFKHMTTRRYLTLVGKQISLIEENDDPNSVFRLHPVIKEHDEIEFETYCRIEHVVSGCWLHAEQEEYKRKGGGKDDGSDMSMTGLQWTTAALRKIGVSEEMQYDDAFTMQQVDDELVQIFNYMAGMVPFLQKLIADKKAGNHLNAKQAHDIIQALKELKEFMIVNSVPNKQRQKLMRNLRIVESLVSLLQVPVRGAPDQRHMKDILIECYDVLYTYLMGDSRKNELYIAKHIHFFESQISYEGEIGLNAAHMVMELVKDNRKIVDRITHKHIDSFVELLTKKKNYRYLDLLSVLCVCDGVSIPDNQNYITEAWLKKGQKNCVYHTELGQTIGKEKDLVYVSTNNKRMWSPLQDFVRQVHLDELEAGYSGNRKDLRADEEFLFLDHQLDLFGKLCHGRNDFAIKVITEELQYLTWDEAFLCLTNEALPDQLRAKYCSLIIGLFVDVGENTSILDNINLTFVYDNIGNKSPRQDKSGREQSITMRYFPFLRDWIADFLDNNKDMTASLIGHNMLIEQVLRLVHYLVKFGYFGDLNDIKTLLVPLLSLVDGRNDKPYPHVELNKKKSEEMKKVWERYKATSRFQQSPETKAIVDAKYQAMEVLDLFFNFRFNTRLEKFIQEFKETYRRAHHDTSGSPELGPLLYEAYDIYDNPSTNKTALHQLDAIFQASSYFSSAGSQLVEILLDLSHYDYGKMVVQSMSLLNRYYSAHDNLFKRAVQAQVLITEESIQSLQEVNEMLPVMHRLKSAKMSAEQSVTMGNILDRMFAMCSLPNEPEERHPMNQSILFNHGILGTIFDILSQEIDIRLIQSEQYAGIEVIFQKSFNLLRVMAKGNEVVQQRLFDRLDMLLNIEGAEPQMAMCLTEVFTGNKQTCMKILPHQIQKIMHLVTVHGNKAPHFLDLLNAVVKVEELNLPLKRNQGYVMKYFMQYRADVAHVIDQPQEARKKLLTGGDSPDLDYLIALVDLLATCAEGENRFIESICQTIFSVSELLEVLNDPKIDNNLKRPYLRFFLWVYLNTASGMIESGAGDLPHDARMWQFLASLNADLTSLTKYATDSPDAVKQLMKRPPGKRGGDLLLLPPVSMEKTPQLVTSEHGQEDWKHHHGTLHYLFEAVMPFVQVFIATYYQPDREAYPQEADQVDELANSLMAFVNVVGPLVSNQTHMSTLNSCMKVVLSPSTLPVQEMMVFLQIMEEFEERFGDKVRVQDIRSDARKKYEEVFEQEEELNNQLNVFAVNYAAAYGGFNEVKTQLGYNMDKEYTELGGDEELPLGQEFQEHLACFVNTKEKKYRKKYALAQKLVQQLFISASETHANENLRVKQEELDIKCLQLLRGIIHNQCVKLPYDWEGDPGANKKLLRQVEEVQNALNEFDAMLKVLPHLSKTRDDIIREVLAFLAAMLFGGNEEVQQKMVDYFLGTREEKFFFAVKNRMQLSAVATKEKRSLMAQHQSKLEEAIEQAKALSKAMKFGRAAAQEIMAHNPMGSALLSASRQGSTAAMRKGGKRGKSGSAALKARYGSQSRIGSQRALQGSSFLGIQEGPGGALGGAHGGASLLAVPGVGHAPPREEKHGIEMATKTPKKKVQDKTPLISKDNKVSPADGAPEIEVEDVDERELEELAYMALEDSMDLEYRDDGYIELVLKILGLMCDGQNRTLQDYLREQPDNIKSVNLVAETSRFLALVYSGINKNTMGLVTELFQTLIEFTSGNPSNQLVVFDTKVCDYINFILRGATFQGCNHREELTLKQVIAGLITALTEESKPMEGQTSSGTVAEEVIGALDAEAIFHVAYECYRKAGDPKLIKQLAILSRTSPKEKQSKLEEDSRDFILNVGFKYFHILQRMFDLAPPGMIKQSRLMRTPEDEAVWQFYTDGTLTIEVLKDDGLQKLYFRCKDRSVLREDVKEKFKYEVDRSSPSSKLREFMAWSRDIMQDIKYTRRVLANPLSSFFVKYWWHFNMGMIFMSFVFFILILVTWKEPTLEDGSSNPLNGTYTHGARPDFAYNAEVVQIMIWVLGAIHNLFSVCVLISYFITNHPTLPKFKRLRKLLSRSNDDDDDDEDEERESNLEVKFFSFTTFWYIILCLCSFLGTVFWGYFFSVHLLHMANFNQLLKRAIQAVTKNGSSLAMVFAYGLIIIYLYALFSFAVYRDLYDPSSGEFCGTMFQCFVTVTHRGLITGLYDFLEVPEGKPFTYHLHKAVFDITFFIFITTIGLNIIFGIIVDTFSELRDNKWNVDNDLISTCFICGRNSYDFEHQGGGFEHHVKTEHNQWAYLFFFIHLDETRPNDYTALELYVHRLLEHEKYEFFPLNRALSLQHEEDSNEKRLETLMEQVAYLVDKMKEEESAKRHEEERLRQLEWEKQHKKKAP